MNTSTPTFAPGGSVTTSTPAAYVIPFEQVRFILKGQYHNPLKKNPGMPLPPHRFYLMDVSILGGFFGGRAPVYGVESQADGISWIRYEEDGRASNPESMWALAWQPLLGAKGQRAPDDATQSLGEVFVDLEKNEWVSPRDVATIDPRRLLRLPLWPSSRKIRQGGFVMSPPDTDFQNTGCLLPGYNELKKFGTPGDPWIVQIDHGLMQSWVRFYYYDPVAKTRKPLPHGVLLSALGKRWLSVGPNPGDLRGRVGAATSLDDSGTFYLLHERTEKESTDLHYYFVTGPRGTADKCIIDYSVPAPAPGARDDRIKIASNDPTPIPTARSVLPTEWHSYGMLAWFDDIFPGYGDRKSFEDVRTAATSKDRPLSFNLDDAVLATDVHHLAPIGKDQRFAIFDHLMTLRLPDIKKPHLCMMVLERNYLQAETVVYNDGHGVEGLARLAYMDGVFYDLRDKRLTAKTKDDLGVVPGVGARAFVANDFDEWHRTKSYMDGNPAMADGGCGRGRTQFHLIDVSYVQHSFPLATGAVMMGLVHLLVFVPLTRKRETTTQAQWETSLAPHLAAAAERWDQVHPGHPGHPAEATEKPATFGLIPKSSAIAGKKLVKVRHYFGEVPETYDKAMKITIKTPVPGEEHRAETDSIACSMTLYEGDIGPARTALVEDGQSPWMFFTLAHEIGHAMGQVDEYEEGVDASRLEKPFRGWHQRAVDLAGERPFAIDAVGMMRSDNKPRLRNYWNYANRVNAESDFRGIVGGDEYVACNASYGGVALVYDLPAIPKRIERARGTCDPYFPVCAFPIGPKHLDATLYRLGQDEGAIRWMFKGPAGIGQILPPEKRVDGILLVRIRFMFSFERTLDNPIRRAHAFRRLRGNFIEGNVAAKRLSEEVYRDPLVIKVEPVSKAPPTESPYLRRIALVFLPEFDFKTRFAGAVPPVGNVNIRMVAKRTEPHPLLADKPYDELELTEDELDVSLVRYALGLQTYEEDATSHIRRLVPFITGKELQGIADTTENFLGEGPVPTRRVVGDL